MKLKIIEIKQYVPIKRDEHEQYATMQRKRQRRYIPIKQDWTDMNSMSPLTDIEILIDKTVISPSKREKD